MSVPLTLAAEAEKIYFQKIKSAASKTIKSAIQFLMKCNSYFKPCQNGVFLLGQEGTELKLRLRSLFSFFFVSHLRCKINLSPRYLRCLDTRVVRTLHSESVRPGSIPSGRLLNFFLFFSFFSSSES